VHWVVVGAGAAGCVVAGRLARRDGTTVTVVEAGPLDVPPTVQSSAFFDALAEPGWTFPGPFVRGRGLGGSSAINGMLAGADAPPSPLSVETPADEELGVVDRALLVADRSATPATLTRRSGRRVTAADAYLAGLGPDRLRIVGGSVERVKFVGRRCVGVVLDDGRGVDGDGVVLCAGAIGTPGVLLRSGVDASGIGAGLCNHPGLPLLLRRREAADVHSLVTGAVLRRSDVQVVALNHLGPDGPEWGMLLTVLMTSSSRGTVRLGEDGVEEATWELDAHDRARLAQAALVATRLAEHEAFRAVIEDVEIGDTPAGVFHWSSTCAIGVVLDEHGAVLGRERLFVADASAFPALPADHLYVPTLRQADHLAAGLP
jgi:choline dehydrogenase-like flavoprotein